MEKKNQKKKIGVVLSGCGVYDGTEIQEAVLSLLAIDQKDWEAVCIAPNINQHEVINHLNGEIDTTHRNVLEESARIARGKIKNLSTFTAEDYAELDALWFPGGFGAAKNLSHWAFLGAQTLVIDEIKNSIIYFIQHKKPIVSLCISPVLIAKVAQDLNIEPVLTLGSDEKAETELKKTGAKIAEVKSIAIDETYKIISVPCYMQDLTPKTIFEQITEATEQLEKWWK